MLRAVEQRVSSDTFVSGGLAALGLDAGGADPELATADWCSLDRRRCVLAQAS
jgi:hypothetical protein